MTTTATATATTTDNIGWCHTHGEWEAHARCTECDNGCCTRELGALLRCRYCR